MVRNVIRFPLRLARQDRRAIEILEREFDEIPVAGRTGPEGERQVRCRSGEIYNLEAVPKFRARRLANEGPGPLPPGGAAALGAA